MIKSVFTIVLCSSTIAAAFVLAGIAHAQAVTRRLIQERIDEYNLVALNGNTRPEGFTARDLGPVPDDFPLPHLLLQLRRSAEQEQALQSFIDQLHTPGSPNFHHWLNAEQYGARYGLAAADVAAIDAWLRSHGFSVGTVYPNNTLIDFGGTAGQVRAAFHTEIHRLNVDGVAHFANMSDPRVPAALSPAIVGILGLHDFRPHSTLKPRASFTFVAGGGTYNAVVPGDLATIYNLSSLFGSGYSGQGQTITVVADSDLFSAADWETFRSTFGLSSYSGTLTTLHPTPTSGNNNCTDPGSTDDNGEATVDAEMATAAAPSATVQVASCGSPTGILIAVENLTNAASPPAIMSISYSECEADNGAASNAAFTAAYQQAVSEGVSVFVSAGDRGAGACDAGAAAALHGIGVNGLASTPYNVAVGGTDFGDIVAGSISYWSATNTATYSSALSYVPEIPWNDSCAGALLYGYFGYTSALGANGFCMSAIGQQNFYDDVAGGGGPSGCAAGTPSVPGIVGGSCAGTPKPTWQSSLLGVPNDGVRDLPDVSLFAANGLWGHYYVFCWSNPTGGLSCTGDPSTWSGGGGTSFSTPLLAGIQALVNQVAGKQGNPNYVYYALAAKEYGAAGNASCISTNGNTTPSSCTFYDITQGDIAVDCMGTNDCYTDGGALGILSTSSVTPSIAFPAATGWDFATGIGSINAFNLVNNWTSVQQTGTSTVIQTNPVGLEFSVDGGVALTAPQTLNLSQGSHVIAVATTQAGAPGTQYAFGSWSDGGQASHTIVVGTSTTTYTATFQTQYQLTTSASPSDGGTVAPASGTFFASGTTVSVSATPAAGGRFVSFSGDVTSTSNPLSIVMAKALNIQANFAANSAPVATSKVGIFRQGFLWILDTDGSQTMNIPPDYVYAFGGIPGDIPITGDWSGDGHTKIGIYRPSNGLFILDTNGDGVMDAGDSVFNLHIGMQPGDIPVTGDWNGDGRTKVGYFRQGFLWILDSNGDGLFEPGIDAVYIFGGIAGDVPVVGDWTGTGTSKIGVVRQGFLWVLDANGNGVFDGTGPGQDLVFPYGGLAGDVPVVGDWKGTGTSEVGVFRLGFLWALDANGDHQIDTGDYVFPFGGIPGDVPVVGKW